MHYVTVDTNSTFGLMATGNFVHHICEQLRELKDIEIPATKQVFADPKRGGPTKCPSGR